MSFDLGAIRRLGELDRELVQARRRLADAVRLAGPQQRRVDEAQALLKRLADESKQGAKAIKSHEMDARSKTGELEKAQLALNTAKNNDEYQALLRTIDARKKELSDIETRILEGFEAQEGRDAEKKRTDERLKQLQAELAEARKRVAEAEGEARAEIARLEAERGQSVASVGPEHLALYDRILGQHGDSAVAAVANEHCQGCYLRVRPDQVSKVRGGNELVTCFNCGRILYMD